jgi:Tfp pilus assembly protein PilN
MPSESKFSISSLGFAASKTIVAFNFSGNLIKMAAAKSLAGGGAEILHLATLNTEGMSDVDIAKLIKDSVKDLKRGANTVLISAIDSQQIITKNIEIPSTNEKEIREIIDLQAGRYTPYAREEIIIDYLIVGTYHNSYTKVLLVILTQDIILRQLVMFEKAGLRVSKIQLGSESVGCASSRLMGLAEKSVPSIVINIDAKSSEFLVLFKGKTIFVRSIPAGYEQLSGGSSEDAARFFEEAKRSLESYRTEDIEAMPADAAIIGGQDKAETIKKALQESLNIPVKAFAFETAVSFSSRAREELNASPRISFVSTISSVLAWTDTRIDARPSELKMRMAFEERSKDIITSGVLVMTAIVFLCILSLIKIYYKGQYLKKLQTQVGALSAPVRELEKASLKVTTVRNYLENKRYSLNILSALYELLPDDVYLKSVSVDEKGNVSLKGTAAAMSEVFNLVSAIENSKVFTKASATNTASRKEGNKDVSDFEITCIIKGKEDPSARQQKDKAKESPKEKEGQKETEAQKEKEGA